MFRSRFIVAFALLFSVLVALGPVRLSVGKPVAPAPTIVAPDSPIDCPWTG